jgi:hypothetical protein
MSKFIGLIIILIFNSCKSNNIGGTDYSDSVSKAIHLLKSKILDDDFKTIKIQIVNKHNGNYLLNAKIDKMLDVLTVSSHVKDMSGVESDTLMTMNISEFIDTNDYLA